MTAIEREVRFWVPGEPRPQPRPRFSRWTGRVHHGEHKSTRDVLGWKHAVALRGVEAMRNARRALLEGPVLLQLVFAMPRPKSHHVARDPKRELREDAPHWHTVKPDRDNLAKAIMDALNGVCWVDDSQVVAGGTLKYYARSSERVGVSVALCSLPQKHLTMAEFLPQELQ